MWISALSVSIDLRITIDFLKKQEEYINLKSAFKDENLAMVDLFLN